MNLNIEVQGFSLTRAIAARVRRRANTSLGRYYGEITAIGVFLKDLNGPKGGEDKSALVRVRLRHRPEVVIESVGDDLYAAIDQSMSRARRAVKRSLGRNRQLLRDRARRDAGLLQANLAVR
jgi:ribosome-associated translation inhibitor RaiA